MLVDQDRPVGDLGVGLEPRGDVDGVPDARVGRALLRPRVIRPGDPVLRIHTDPAIVSVVALFPFGLEKPLRFISGENVWQTRFLAPPVISDHREAPVNALGYLRVVFAVDDLDETLGKLRKRGAQLVGEVVKYQNSYELCYIRGPEGLLIGLAQELS